MLSFLLKVICYVVLVAYVGWFFMFFTGLFSSPARMVLCLGSNSYGRRVRAL